MQNLKMLANKQSKRNYATETFQIMFCDNATAKKSPVVNASIDVK